MRTCTIIALVVILAWSAPAAAQTEGWVGACERESSDGQRAHAAIRRFSERLEQSAPTDPPAPLAAAWQELLEDPCLALAAEVGAPVLRSVPAMQAWWGEGGSSWLYSLLGAERTVTVPPTMPAALSLRHVPADREALRPLLCRAGDEACGRATAGWRIRAEEAFGRHGRAHLDEAQTAARMQECVDGARREDSDQRYLAWIRCAAAALPRRATFPVGHYRAPDHGWLVMRGRRGHYQWCEEVRAYDLATGAAYVVRECGALFARNGAPIPPGPETTVGRVPVENLREAAWVLFMADALETRLARSHDLQVPEGIERRFRASSLGFGRGFGSGWGHSGQTRIAWAWVDGGDTLVQGNLTWPDSSDAGQDHAAALLRIAEAALEPGCAPAAIPPGLPIGTSRAAVSGIDADPGDRQRIEDRLVSQMRGLDRGSCAPAPRRGRRR